jgi:hypothetical protein
MIFGFPRTKVICLLGAAAAVVLAAATLIPGSWVPRTGLGFKFEHFTAYFVTAMVLGVASRRPYVVAGSLVVVAAILEALQNLTPDRSADLTAPLAAATGAICGATLLMVFLWLRSSLVVAWKKRPLSSLIYQLKRLRGRGYTYSTGQRPA